jgi:hypothetical protein
MLHVSELRINNSVISHKHNGLITEIHTIMPNGVRLWANPFAPCYNFDEISGILLTEELLLKMGLKADDSVGYGKDEPYYKLDNMFHVSASGTICIFHYFDDDVQIVRCRFLHEFQNAFYLLTGREITLS